MIIKVFVVLLVCITSKNLQTDNNLTMFPDEQSFFKYSVKANEEEILKEKIKKVFSLILHLFMNLFQYLMLLKED